LAIVLYSVVAVLIKEKYRNTKNPKYSDKKMELLLADSNSFDEKVPL
jgi:hypothetical protein